jgi:hypothetical protein
MVERGSFSFVALLVINPILILLYQNCSLLPVTQSEIAAREVSTPKRGISSMYAPQKVDLSKMVAKPSLAACDAAHGNCPVAEIE